MKQQITAAWDNLNLAIAKTTINGEEIDFYFRPDSTGDKGVLQQIFINEDYRVLYWEQGKRLTDYYQARAANGETALILDAGANIGASAVYFAKTYPASIVFAVEPEKNNATILALNAHKRNIKIFNAGIRSEDGEMFLQDPGLSDWAFRVAEAGEVKVDVVTPIALLVQSKDLPAYPLICKIDIEGGEGNLFERDIEWVDQFPLIVIELHDWMLPFQGSSRNFFKAIAAFDFDVVHRGENIFCFNRRILAP